MTSPAAASSLSRSLDPTKNGRYTIRLGESLTKPAESSSVFGSVKFNHKPRQNPASTRTTTITSAPNGNSTLTVHDKDTARSSTYNYTGQRTKPQRSYVLIFDQAKQTCTLEPLTSAYTFNLASTPREPSAAKLRAQYPQLHPSSVNDTVATADTILTADADVADDADENNPYDWRHYLHQGREASGSVSPESRLTSAINTPRTDGGRFTPTVTQARRLAVKAQTQQPRADATSTARKRSVEDAAGVKAKPTSTAATAAAVEKRDAVPTVKLDRRASTRHEDTAAPTMPPKSESAKSEYDVHSDEEEGREEDENDAAGGLTIDFGDATPPAKKRLRQLSPGTGPISLRSAANSAAASPDVRPAAPSEQPHVIEFGDIDIAGENGDEEAEGEEDNGYATDDEDVDGAGADRDVDLLSLGSPAHEKAQAVGLGLELGREGEADEDEDADAVFEAEMLKELASQEEGDAGVVGAGAGGEESEEESEEE